MMPGMGTARAWRRAAVGAAALAMLAAASARAEPNIRLLADSCAMCHGTDGRSPGPLDSLAGEPAGELLEEMMEFKTEPGKGRIMSVLVKGYSDAQLRALAEYFAGLPR